jgi:DNA-binding YbaB/EbfC family protein
MARRKRQKSGGGLGKTLGNVGGMTQKLQNMQQQMLEAQEALGDEVVEVSVGGGVFSVEMTGHQKLNKVYIDPDIVDPEDVEVLQDLVIAAINEAVEKSQQLASERLGGLTGGLNIPGLF